ncbi:MULTISPECIES: hypothetical protein [Streptomyces]|uniref:Response regulatory domain-containing protein n=1 Tax=Streptomyces lonegramiae TaxID=3075524 RepID=A0ABU2XRV7_9ACTN|nr:hypothetical protein [Streptomyces sp. DSM 41529]MDT0548265.1 hypothetical protein [Streptomyces sp. DSM 41529]
MTGTVTDNVNDRIRVVVVDDHTVMRAGVIALLAAEVVPRRGIRHMGRRSCCSEAGSW